MNGCLMSLAEEYPTVKFCKIKATETKLSMKFVSIAEELGDCIVFENFTASIGDLMVVNWVYWQYVSGASKRIFVTMKFSITIQLSPF